MEAYSALVSLTYTIQQIEHHPRPPVSLDKEQVESLTENVTFLQEFLESRSPRVGYSKEADGLESRIADAAHAAEDVIESHVVDQILAGTTSHGKTISSNIDFYECLQKVIEDMDLIKKGVMEIKEKTGAQAQLQRNSTPASSVRSSSTGQNTMVCSDDVLLEIMDRLTGGQLGLQIIPIVGMGGIGKTTLARNIISKRLIKEHFDICAWATISQEYNTQEIIREVLSQRNKEGMGDLSENVLGEILYKHLSGRRYLIVMDDMWNIEAWDDVRRFFPDNKNGSRLVITTRLSNLAFQLTDSYVHKMRFLNVDESWNLFSKSVFGEESCPLELEEIGKKIVEHCKGLPLSIVVIGGLLAKSKRTQEYWEYVGENLNSIVNSEDSESCFEILYMSYNQLPVYLKPCFLYMGVFSEDRVICVSDLVQLWVAEGFLKPFSCRSLEVVAKEYLKDLIDRNLILVHKLGLTGNIKTCRIHDLLRDLCLREAQRERFYNVIIRQQSFNLPQSVNTQRRIVIPESTSTEKVLDPVQSTSLARSLICDFPGVLPSPNFRLLRILKASGKYQFHTNEFLLEDIFKLVNSRYVAVGACWGSKFVSSVYFLWNLHTLIVDSVAVELTAPPEIWSMSQLRHVNFRGGLCLPDPSGCNADGRDEIVMENLQMLSTVNNFKFGEEAVKRLPNIKKLRLCYLVLEGRSSYYPDNLDRLHKLESFACSFFSSGTDFVQNLTFPQSLKKLTLEVPRVCWQDVLEKIGSLPLLEKLQLFYGSFKGGKWETVEGQFCSLKFLLLDECLGLQSWTTESSHFPRLEHLILRNIYVLEEIPSDIGEIATLKSIELENCSYSAAVSAKEILEEQEELGGVGLRVRIILEDKNEALEKLACPNFQLEYSSW